MHWFKRTVSEASSASFRDTWRTRNPDNNRVYLWSRLSPTLTPNWNEFACAHRLAKPATQWTNHWKGRPDAQKLAKLMLVKHQRERDRVYFCRSPTPEKEREISLIFVGFVCCWFRFCSFAKVVLVSIALIFEKELLYWFFPQLFFCLSHVPD